MILLGNPYTIKNGVVHWGRHPVPQADPETFQHLGGSWARDLRQVFVHDKPKKIDIATFEYLNPVFVKDARNAYDWEGSIKGADARTFETTRALRGADPRTFVSLRNNFGYDSKNIWCQKTKLPRADAKTWVCLGRWWSMDRDRIFYGATEVPGIDRTSFTVVAAPTGPNLATDGDRFFTGNRVIPEEEFWSRISEDFARFETWFRARYHGIRKTCTTCSGSGDCYCKRKEEPSESCARCNGSGKCHLCNGVGRVRS